MLGIDWRVLFKRVAPSCRGGARDAGGQAAVLRQSEGRRRLRTQEGHPLFAHPPCHLHRCHNPLPPARSSHGMLRHAPRLTKLCLMSMGKLDPDAVAGAAPPARCPVCGCPVASAAVVWVGPLLAGRPCAQAPRWPPLSAAGGAPLAIF